MPSRVVGIVEAALDLSPSKKDIDPDPDVGVNLKSSSRPVLNPKDSEGPDELVPSLLPSCTGGLAGSVPKASGLPCEGPVGRIGMGPTMPGSSIEEPLLELLSSGRMLPCIVGGTATWVPRRWGGASSSEVSLRGACICLDGRPPCRGGGAGNASSYWLPTSNASWKAGCCRGSGTTLPSLSLAISKASTNGAIGCCGASTKLPSLWLPSASGTGGKWPGNCCCPKCCCTGGRGSIKLPSLELPSAGGASGK